MVKQASEIYEEISKGNEGNRRNVERFADVTTLDVVSKIRNVQAKATIVWLISLRWSVYLFLFVLPNRSTLYSVASYWRRLLRDLCIFCLSETMWFSCKMLNGIPSLSCTWYYSNKTYSNFFISNDSIYSVFQCTVYLQFQNWQIFT